MDNQWIARIVVDKTVYQIDKPYDYLVPPSLKDDAKPGCRVLIPFGRTTRQGLILSVSDRCDCELSRLKPIISVLDDEPILSEERLQLAQWLKDRTFCTYFDAVRVLLPAGISLKMKILYRSAENAESRDPAETQILNLLKELDDFCERDKLLQLSGLRADCDILEVMRKKGLLLRSDRAARKVGDLTVKAVRLRGNPIPKKLTEKQNAVVEFLKTAGEADVKELCYFTGVTTAVVTTLSKHGVVELFDRQVYRSPIQAKKASATEIKLTNEQEKVYEGLYEAYEGGYSVNLLYGVTGSGKTQVFLKMADKVVQSGRGVIVMVPEIALTLQTISIFNRRYGNRVAVFHSAMSQGQRTDEWQRVKRGEALVAIGTRSAVFAPFDDLGLVIIDEEQEHTYNSEQNPKFHARDVAKFRCNYHGAMLILASATPSVESFFMAKAGRYHLWTLKKRYGKAKLPEVTTVDMREQFFRGNRSFLSDPLKEKLNDTLENGNQAILLMNRRGYNTFVSCAGCGEVLTCPNCSISLNYHAANGRMMCHYCGYSEPYVTVCKKCGGTHMKYLGVGTQRIEEELRALYPEASILRMDADSTMTKNAYEEKLSAFSREEYNIMLGTQMVAKGLDFPKVTLVGVLNADQSMYSSDFRSFERTFSLLTQVVGRSGRGAFGGSAIIQTVHPDDNTIKLASQQDYDSFYETEIATRRLMIYPPFCEIAVLSVYSLNRTEAENGAKELFRLLVNGVKGDFSDVKLNILGPSVAAIPKINNKYRYRLMIKFKSFARFGALLKASLSEYYQSDFNKTTTVSVDINPENAL